MLKLNLTKRALKELKYWQQNQPKIYQKILAMIEETRNNPFGGLNKPEPLKHNLSGYWSKRITKGDRLIYKVIGNVLEIIQCRHHY